MQKMQNTTRTSGVGVARGALSVYDLQPLDKPVLSCVHVGKFEKHVDLRAKEQDEQQQQ